MKLLVVSLMTTAFSGAMNLRLYKKVAHTSTKTTL